MFWSRAHLIRSIYAPANIGGGWDGWEYNYDKIGRRIGATEMITTKSDVAWLIELAQHARDGAPEYWSAIDHDGDRNIYGWDRDVNHAMRFADRAAAQTYIDVFAIENALAIEHAWV